MPYVIRRKNDQKYLSDDGRYGPLEEAYVYGDLQNAQDEVADAEEEVVEIALSVLRVVPRV